MYGMRAVVSQESDVVLLGIAGVCVICVLCPVHTDVCVTCGGRF
jgi:hypothetical protein